MHPLAHWHNYFLSPSVKMALCPPICWYASFGRMYNPAKMNGLDESTGQNLNPLVSTRIGTKCSAQTWSCYCRTLLWNLSDLMGSDTQWIYSYCHALGTYEDASNELLICCSSCNVVTLFFGAFLFAQKDKLYSLRSSLWFLHIYCVFMFLP